MGALLIADLISEGVKGAEAIADTIRAAKLNKLATKALPPSTDPQEQENLAILNAMRKGTYTGAAYGEATRQLNNNQAGVNQTIVNTGGGAGGAILSALGQANDQYGNNYGKIFSENEGNKLAYNQMYFDQSNRMIQRRAGLAMMRYAQLKAEATQSRQSSRDDINNLAATFPALYGTGNRTAPDEEDVNPDMTYLPTKKLKPLKL